MTESLWDILEAMGLEPNCYCCGECNCCYCECPTCPPDLHCELLWTYPSAEDLARREQAKQWARERGFL